MRGYWKRDAMWSDLQQVSLSRLNCDTLKKEDSSCCIASWNGVLQHVSLPWLRFKRRCSTVRDCMARYVLRASETLKICG